jgi:cobalt-zinc-cadmium efflux system protein
LLELGGGLLARSLALLADSAHVFMDAVALGVALFALVQARRPATSRHSYGYARLEILAALGNAALLFAVAVLIVVEAARRFASPQLPEGHLMLAVALAGATVNVALGFALARGARHDLNVKAALLHVASDALGALAVAVAAGLVIVIRAPWVDPLASLVVAAIILAGVIHIVREAGDVLLESAPLHAAIPDVRERIRLLEGVVEVHDLHVWTIGSGHYALSAHVRLDDRRISEASSLLARIEARMRAEFGITHLTIQFECKSCEPDERIVCTQAPR